MCAFALVCANIFSYCCACCCLFQFLRFRFIFALLHFCRLFVANHRKDTRLYRVEPPSQAQRICWQHGQTVDSWYHFCARSEYHAFILCAFSNQIMKFVPMFNPHLFSFVSVSLMSFGFCIALFIGALFSLFAAIIIFLVIIVINFQINVKFNRLLLFHCSDCVYLLLLFHPLNVLKYTFTNMLLTSERIPNNMQM